ncbi:MAG TPA: acyltransferase [Telluria sp.]|jgi:peptidoglycan/LPS O-acetylase OafA/YrhL
MTQVRSANIAYLDGWRGLAIVGVLVGHFILRPRFSWMANVGVQLFFALSGYLMAYLLFIKQVGMADFFARRLSRVMPTFILFILAMAVVSANLGPAPYSVPVQELIATLTFLRTYFPPGASIWEANWPIGHVWSLNVEEHSYIFLALGALWARRSGSQATARVFLLASVAAVVLVCIAYTQAPPAGAAPWFIRTECAALGLIAAAAIRVVRHGSALPWLRTVPALLPVLWVVMAAAAISTFKQYGGQYIIAPLCLALAVNYLDCAPRLLHAAFSNPVLTWFGKCSFSLYLWQQPFFLLALKNQITPLQGCAMGIVAGTVSFYAFENPLRVALNNAWAARRERIPPAATGA